MSNAYWKQFSQGELDDMVCKQDFDDDDEDYDRDECERCEEDAYEDETTMELLGMRWSDFM